MNRIHTTVAIAGLCAVIVGWQVWTRVVHEPATTPIDSPDNKPLVVRPLDAAAAGTRPQATVATPIEVPLKNLEDANCYVDQVVIHPQTGEPVDAIACEPMPGDPRPYENWSEQVLAGLAYGDPIAAEVLGLRHIQSDDPNQEALGLMLLYRSVALSGQTDALHRAIGQRYATVAKNGEPDIHNLKQLLVFAIVATKLGDARIRPDSVESRLASAEVPAIEISELKSAAKRILREMAAIETEITGNTTIREALSNA